MNVKEKNYSLHNNMIANDLSMNINCQLSLLNNFIQVWNRTQTSKCHLRLTQIWKLLKTCEGRVKDSRHKMEKGLPPNKWQSKAIKPMSQSFPPSEPLYWTLVELWPLIDPLLVMWVVINHSAALSAVSFSLRHTKRIDVL